MLSTCVSLTKIIHVIQVTFPAKDEVPKNSEILDIREAQNQKIDELKLK